MARLSWPVGNDDASSSKATNKSTKPNASTKPKSQPTKKSTSIPSSRPSTTARTEPAPVEAGGGQQTLERKTISARSLRRASTQATRAAAPQAPESAKRKRGRPSLNKDKNEGATETHGRKRARSSISSEQVQPTTKRRGRPSATRKSQDSAPEPQTEPETTRPKKRRRKSDEPANTEPGSDSDGSVAPYRHLESRTRHVTRKTIEEKWEPLDRLSVANVTALLGSAARPVLLRLRNMQKHNQATAILNVVGNKLRNKLTRGMPFPPPATAGKREDELEFDKTIAGLEALEYQLDPLLHSVQLLQREKERAEKQLEQEYKVLNRLTANARTAARERRDHVRKMHGLVPDRAPDQAGEDFADIGDDQPVADATSDVGNIFLGLEEQDKELASLATQIANHMDSLKSNLRQIDGVVPAVGQSEAALRARLLEHFEPEIVDKVVLG